MNINLLEETVSVMDSIKKDWADVVSIGSKDGEFAMPVDAFKLLANHEYDSGFGSSKVAEDLVIVFKDNTWLARKNFNGQENWIYVVQPKLKKVTKHIINLFAKRGWETLNEIANPETNGY